MRIYCLVENHENLTGLNAEHGLSLFIKSNDKNILFDFGSSALFEENAKLLNLPLETVDFGVLSHGHYDHGGGLPVFLNLNATAKVFVREEAFQTHMSDRGGSTLVNIGIDKQLQKHPQLVFTEDLYLIEKEMLLFSDITSHDFYPKGNYSMLSEYEHAFILDDFKHEQNLILWEADKTVLFAGCAHRGILNIVQKAADHIGKMPDVVIGGFHLSSKHPENCESEEDIRNLAKALLKTGAQYYTGHCTGDAAYTIMKTVMGNQIDSLFVGKIIEI